MPNESESESQSVVSDCLRPHGLYSLWNSPGQNTGVGSLSLLQAIFPTRGSNPGLLHCRQILYQLSHMKAQMQQRVNNCWFKVKDKWVFIILFNFLWVWKSSYQEVKIPCTFYTYITSHFGIMTFKYSGLSFQITIEMGFPGGTSGKEPACQCR